MFIVAYILFGLGVVLLVCSVVAFFKLNVREAYNFTKNKRGTNTLRSATTRIKPRKQKREYSGKRTLPEKIEIQEADDSATGNLDEEASESATDLLDEDSENPTNILEEDSEKPTGILEEESEKPTGILEEESEKPTGILEEESEKPTGVLVEESEKPTGILTEDSEKPTSILPEDIKTSQKGRKPKKVVKRPAKKTVVKRKQDKEKEQAFKFELVKDEVVVHTKESIK